MAISLGGMKLKQIAQRSFFCLSFAFSIGSTGAAVATPLDITVMTQNLYIGADTLPILSGPLYEDALPYPRCADHSRSHF